MNSGDPALAGGWIPDLFSGNAEEVWMLWQHNQCHVQRVLRTSFCLSQWDMEEVMSITMLKFYEQFPKHCGKIRNLSAWLARLAQNTATDHLRKEKRRQQRYENFDELQHYAPLMESSRNFTQEEETKQTLEKMLMRARLSANLLETAIARFVHGRTYSEIACTQQVPVATVRKRIQSIRERLRGKLNEQEQRAGIVPGRPSATVTSRILPRPGTHPDSFVHIFFQWKPMRSVQRAATLERYLEKREPRDSRKWLELAEMYLAGGLWAKARDCYEACHRKYPSLLEAGWRAAQLHFLLGNQTRAQQLCKELLRAGPPSLVHLLRGYSASIEGDWAAARTAWEHAALLEPENPDYHLHVFHALMAAGRFEEARSRIERVLAIFPDHHRAMNLILPLLYAKGDYALLQHYTGILYSQGDRNAAVIKYHADLRQKAGNCTPSENDSLGRQVMQALQMAPGFTGLLDTRASQLHGTNGSLRLTKFLDSIIQSQPACSSTWKVRAIWMCQQGRIEEAINAARTARELAPENRAILAAMAWVAIHPGAKELQAEALDSLLIAGSVDPRLMLSAAVVCLITGSNLKLALELSQIAMESAGTDPFIFYGRGRTLAQAGWMQQALEAFQSAWEIVFASRDHILLPHLRYEMNLIRAASGETVRLEQCAQQEEAPMADSLNLPVCLGRPQGPARLPLSDLLLFFARCYDTSPAFTVPM